MKQRCFKCFQIFWLEAFFDGFQLLSKLFGLKQVSSRFLVFSVAFKTVWIETSFFTFSGF